ncbi:LuxR family transcriptional regulator [Sinorhizobium meliloti]|nr:LuxR family transcriptional regulator [Sinorhizobium meliloti]
MQEMITRGRLISNLPRGGDFAPEIARLETQFDIIRYMRRITPIFGFKTFLICSILAVEVERLSATTVISNMPADSSHKYAAFSMLRFSTGVRRLRETTTAGFRSSLKTGEGGRQARLCRGLHRHVARQRIFQANYFPFPRCRKVARRGHPHGPGSGITDDAAMELQMIAIHVYNRLARSALYGRTPIRFFPNGRSSADLDGAGKTSSEIAGILGLSTHGESLLNHVTKKLDAVNRTQAVVRR